MFLFPISAKTLWSLVQINQRQEDKDKGYQRVFSESRINKISKYLDGGNAIPGAILISFDKAKFIPKDSKLIIENVDNAGWVIDGQHRLIGAHLAKADIHVPVVAFLNLSLEQQVELFVTVNREQKGVPSSLYYDLLKLLPRTLSDSELIQERANDLATKLRQDEESPFHRKIKTTTSPKQGELSSTNVVRKLTPHLKRDGRLEGYGDEVRARILNNLYRALEQVFPAEYKREDTVFFRTIGFGAIMNALPVIMDTTFRLSGKMAFRVEDVAETFKLLKTFKFDLWRQMGTGNAAEMSVSEDLRMRLEKEGKAKDGQGIQL
jgi:DGQHR domain-containing protein